MKCPVRFPVLTTALLLPPPLRLKMFANGNGHGIYNVIEDSTRATLGHSCY